MKTINTYITERLKLSNKPLYKYHPQTKSVLRKLIDDLIKERGDNADLNDIDTSEITDMSYLFFESEFNGNISKWDVSRVEDMHGMFLKSYFTGENGNINDWDISNVSDMRNMFSKSKFNKDISNWDAHNAHTYNMFDDCPIKDNYKPQNMSGY